ncbi:hypothetical protein AURDEDRAFT_113428 [Auricularia subglabra TFB-10046 SS5]|nr:hypothetical protein AURDEDRAFT_113428 [Auricularia subglabra TFB-10046 SS5]
MDELDIVFVDDGPNSDALPVDLLACDAPNLRYLRLVSVQLFANKIPSAFAAVEDFEYCFGEAESFPTSVFAHCTALKKLTIYGKYCSLAADGGEELRAVDRCSLQSVDVSVFSGSFDIMRHIPCASIPDITVALNDQQSAQLLLAHLRGRLEVHLYQTDSNVYVRYTSLETGMRRSFACVMEQPATGSLPAVYVADDLVSRIDAIHTSGYCTGLLAAFCELRSCKRLVVSLGEHESCFLPPRPLSAPALDCLELSSAAPATIGAVELAMFLDAALLPRSRPVRVALKSVRVDDNLAALGDRFTIAEARLA